MMSFREYCLRRESVDLEDPDTANVDDLYYNPGNRLLSKKQQRKFSKKKVLKKLAKFATRLAGGTVSSYSQKGGEFYPANTLNIPRSQMPQLKSREDFVSWLMQNGIKVEKIQATPRSIVQQNQQALTGHAQANMYWTKAMNFIKKNTLLKKLIILTSDGIIFDGNHHWLGLMMVAPDQPVPMYRVNLDFQRLLQLSKQFPGVTYEEGMS
jgi:hypothetical protein